MMGVFEQKRREGFIEACLHLINRDFEALGKDFVTLGYMLCLPNMYNLPLNTKHI